MTPTLILSVVFTVIGGSVLILMVLLFAGQSLPVWKHLGWDYLTGKQWFYRAQSFDSLPMIYGTLLVAAVAILLAAPIGIGTAIFATEFLPQRARMVLKIAIELLSGIPSVVYGLLGVLILRNWVYKALEPFDPLSGDTLVTAGLLLAVMILPTIMTLADDALASVPRAQRLAARGLGLTATETLFSVTLPQALPGILSACILALGRALGETIAVFLVVGRQDNRLPEAFWSLRPLLESGQTLTSKLGGAETNIAYGDPLHWAAIVGLGLILLGLTAATTTAGLFLSRRQHRHA